MVADDVELHNRLIHSLLYIYRTGQEVQRVYAVQQLASLLETNRDQTLGKIVPRICVRLTHTHTHAEFLSTIAIYTVEPPNNGHVGTRHIVLLIIERLSSLRGLSIIGK